jgi:hypothetical protein
MDAPEHIAGLVHLCMADQTRTHAIRLRNTIKPFLLPTVMSQSQLPSNITRAQSERPAELDEDLKNLQAASDKLLATWEAAAARGYVLSPGTRTLIGKATSPLQARLEAPDPASSSEEEQPGPAPKEDESAAPLVCIFCVHRLTASSIISERQGADGSQQNSENRAISP